MKNSSASLFLQKKKKCLLFFSGKQLSASLFLQKKNKAPHYFFRKNGAPPYFFRKKIKHQIISSEKNVFFFKKKRHLIFILKISWGALFFSEEILRHLIFVCEELMRRLMFFWRRHEALGLVASIFLLMLFLQWQNQVPQYFFRKKSSASSFLQKKC